MATKTKTATKPALPDWQSEIAEELEKQDQRRRAAYGILFRYADGEEPTREELAFLKAAGFDDATRRREQSRFNRALLLLRKAGTRAERDATAAKLAELDSALSGKVDQLQAEIDRLTAERDNAQRHLTATRADANQRQAAVDQLRMDGLLPEFVRGQMADLRKTAANSEPARTEREAETRINVIQGVLAITDKTQRELHAQGNRLSDGTPLLLQVGKGAGREVNFAAWAKYLDELRAELPVREAELEAARKELAYFTKEEQQLRDFWLSDEIESMVSELGGDE